MSRDEKSGKLTNREVEVLNLLWEAGKPCVASDLAKMDDSLSLNTIFSVLRVLLKKGYVEIADIVYSGTVLTRSYRPTALAEDLSTEHFVTQYKQLIKSISPTMLFAALLDSKNDDDTLITDLETIIREKKGNTKRG